MRKDQPPIDDLPQEVKEYYRSEKRQKTGVAWLLALGTLILTLGVAAALFFGGTWLWNRFSNDDKQANDTAQTQTDSTEQQPATEDQSNGDSTAAITGSDYSTSSPTEQSTTSGSNQATSSTNTESQASSASIPATGDTTEPEALVNTGPGDE